MALTLVEEAVMMVRFAMVVVGVLLMSISPASAQIKSQDIVGTWAGVLELTGDKSPVEVNFTSDGKMTGSVKTAKEGLVRYKGGWRIDGAKVLVDYVADAATGTANVPAVGTSSWTLTKPQANALSGFGIRKSDNLQYDVKLNKK